MKISAAQTALLTWYDTHGRDLPWRCKSGVVADPYRVWLSEIMLQQTTVATVIPYFEAFVARWPQVADLAAAPLEDVLAAWAGLGYYSRARNLHACAQTVAGQFGGHFPSQEDDLRQLPGIGPYTAAAIAAIAFGRVAVVVDGNVARVMTRLHASPVPLRDNGAAIRQWATALTPQHRPGDHAQAVMDLGATLCRPTAPACGVCPLRGHCQAQAKGLARALPIKAEKPPKATRYGQAYLIEDSNGALLIDQRPLKGLLGGMHGLPTSSWLDDLPAPLAGSQDLDLIVRHTFTHFHLVLHLRGGTPDLARHFPNARFVTSLQGLALPSLFKKALKKANGPL